MDRTTHQVFGSRGDVMVGSLKFKSSLLATCLLLSWAGAEAQDDAFDLGEGPPKQKPAPLFVNNVELGLGIQNKTPFHFARYGGVTDGGTFPFLTGSLSGRDPWTSDSTMFWAADFAVKTTDLAAISARFGQQGSWKVGAFYNAFSRNHTESAKTPFGGVGTDRLFLPSDWATGNSSLRFTTLAQNLKPLELKTDWQTFGGDFVLAPPGTGYELRFKFDQRHRNGLKANSLTFGHEANFPVGVFFPETVDYESRRFNAILSYADPRLQWNAAYELATFDNAVKSISVPNPYSRSLGPSWPAGAFAGYPFAFGQYSLPPDNTAHSISASAGYALTPQTRLSGKVAYAIQKQNDAFFPYSMNSNLSAPEALPRNSLDGDIRKTFLNVGLSSREAKNVELTASYTLDKRTSHTERNLYSYIPNDVQNQVTPALTSVSRYIRFNLPHSYTFQHARAEAAYRFTPQTRLSLTYSGDFKWRNYQQVHQSDDHALKLKLQTGFESGSAWVSYNLSHRTGSDYIDDVSWNASHTSIYLNASPLNQSIEHPLLKAFHLADRIRREAKAGTTFDITQALTVSGSAGYAREKYPNTVYGRQNSSSLIVDGDVSYAVFDHLSASAFYSFERYRYAQKGYYIFTVNLSNLNQEWGAQNRDKVYSMGTKLDWTVIAQKLKLTAAYTLSRGIQNTDVQATPFTLLATVAPVPSDRDFTRNLSLRAALNLTAETIVKVGYTYEHHISSDWQYDNVGVTPVAQILGSAIIPPRYNVHVGSLSVAYQF